MEKKRESRRYRFHSQVEFYIDGSSRKCTGATIDVSPEGFCLYTKTTMKEGQVIKLTKHIMPLEHSLAQVRWVRNGAAYFEAGFLCL